MRIRGGEGNKTILGEAKWMVWLIFQGLIGDLIKVVVATFSYSHDVHEFKDVPNFNVSFRKHSHSSGKV